MGNRSKGFVLVAAKRSSGAAYWLARGTIDGTQVRREFSVREEALAFIEQRTSEQHGETADRGTVTTHLSPTAVRNAEVAIAQLERDFPNRSLIDAVEYYREVAPMMPLKDAVSFNKAFVGLKAKYPDATLSEVCAWFTQHFRPSKNAVTLKIALEHYGAEVLRRKETKALSQWQFDSIGFAMSQLEKYFGPDTSIANLTTVRLKEYLEKTTRARDGGATYSNKTWANRRSYLMSFFTHCVGEHWLEDNPAQGLKKFTKADFSNKTPCILTAKEARKLMEHLENYAGGRLVPYFVLTMFCGIRPTAKNGEIGRVEEADLDLRLKELTLPKEKTKTGEKRVVRLEPNVVQWLKAYPLREFPIIATNFRKLHLKVRADFKLGYDVLRHTYCSMLVGKYRSVGDAALQAGNSEDVIWSNYLNLVRDSEARTFWNIKPRR